MIRCLIDIIIISATEIKSKALSLTSFNKSGRFDGKLYFGFWLIFGFKGKNNGVANNSNRFIIGAVFVVGRRGLK